MVRVFLGAGGVGLSPDLRNTCVVVPVLPLLRAPKPAGRLNPVVVEGVECVVLTHFLGAVAVSALGRRVGSLADYGEAVMAALDMVFVGF